MIRIELTPEEAQVLRQVLECCLDDLRDEIRHTDKKDFRNRLKSQEESLKHLLQRLEVEDVKVRD